MPQAKKYRKPSIRAVLSVVLITIGVVFGVVAIVAGLQPPKTSFVPSDNTALIPEPPAGTPLAERLRWLLDGLGGADIALVEFDGSCAGTSSDACTFDSQTIGFSQNLDNRSWANLHWVMAHELAHTAQLNVWEQLTRSGLLDTPFGGDGELLANCMAAQRGLMEGSGCTAAQLDAAAQVWDGEFP